MISWSTAPPPRWCSALCFSPTSIPFVGTIASLGTYAVGFFARPVGGALFGHFGDRLGRKSMLMLTMVVMALGTFLVGCLPTYDQVGIWAPILLVTLRLIQGVGLGGEWGGASPYFVGTLFTVCFASPLFWLLDSLDPQVIIVTIAVALGLGHGSMLGLQSTYFPELFGSHVRYSGASVGFQLSAAIGGGLSPLIAAALVERMGGTAGVSIMLIGWALITFIAVLFAPETKDQPLHA